EFLSLRPLNTVILAGLIRDNGLESLCNRGRFYACRDAAGVLAGVALVGHVTLFEARDGVALAALAESARAARGLHSVVGESEGVRLFCAHHSRPTKSPLQVRREIFLVKDTAPAAFEAVRDLRPATRAQLPAIVSASAEMVESATGFNPLASDPEGFWERTARRVERGRVWAWFEDDRLVFKIDVAAETPEAIYLEGLYVNPRERGRGHGLRCFEQLSDTLLRRAPALCLLVDEGNAAARRLYARLGFVPHCAYDRVSLVAAR
ncbi:MAG: GNAT family N-acetyltransferase, partial [Acidobacteria bacterium]|nr:GNAT family N-acetyltransferase [Acidobacteriota bacterium]